MKFNYQTEKIKFEKKWNQLKEEYKKAGLSEERTEEIRKYDWEMFKAERVFARHNQHLDTVSPNDDAFDKDEGQNQLYDKFFENLTACDKHFTDYLDWIEQIENYEIYKTLKSMSEKQLVIITAYVFEGKTQKKIADELEISQSALAQQFNTIRKKLKKFI